MTNILKEWKVSNNFNKENTLSILAESWRGEHTLPMCCTSPWYTVTHISESDIHKSITKIRLFTHTDFIETTNKHTFPKTHYFSIYNHFRLQSHTLLICSWVLFSLCNSGVSVTILNPLPLLSSKSLLYFTYRIENTEKRVVFIFHNVPLAI